MNETTLITHLNTIRQQLPMPNPNPTRPREMGIVFAKRNNNHNYRDIATEFIQTSYQLQLLQEQSTIVG